MKKTTLVYTTIGILVSIGVIVLGNQNQYTTNQKSILFSEILKMKEEAKELSDSNNILKDTNKNLLENNKILSVEIENNENKLKEIKLSTKKENIELAIIKSKQMESFLSIEISNKKLNMIKDEILKLEYKNKESKELIKNIVEEKNDLAEKDQKEIVKPKEEKIILSENSKYEYKKIVKNEEDLKFKSKIVKEIN